MISASILSTDSFQHLITQWVQTRCDLDFYQSSMGSLSSSSIKLYRKRWVNARGCQQISSVRSEHDVDTWPSGLLALQDEHKRTLHNLQSFLLDKVLNDSTVRYIAEIILHRLFYPQEIHPQQPCNTQFARRSVRSETSSYPLDSIFPLLFGHSKLSFSSCAKLSSNFVWHISQNRASQFPHLMWLQPLIFSYGTLQQGHRKKCLIAILDLSSSWANSEAIRGALQGA